MLHGIVFVFQSILYYYSTLAMVVLNCYSVNHLKMMFIFQNYQITFQSVSMHLNQWCYVRYNSGKLSSKVIQQKLKSITLLCMNCTCVLVRVQMGTVDVKVSSGQLDVSKEKNLLVWGLGKHCAPAQNDKKETF